MLVEKSANKLKILTISDHPLVPSGVGSQMKYIIEGLLATGKYQFLSIGAAIKHQDYRPQKIEPFGNDWVILPFDGYGNPEIIRLLLDQEKSDGIMIFSDPRFYIWFFEMSDEIKDRNIPIFYNTIWDEKPTPTFNKPFYDCCDFLGCISKLTYSNMLDMGLQDKSEYIPHAVNHDIFAPLSKDMILSEKAKALGQHKDKFVVFYVSRNARRKMTSDVLKTFKMFMDKYNLNEKCFLLMHCDPHDPEGANLLQVAQMLKLRPDQITFSNQKFPPDIMRNMYNMSDVTINISNNEGFGLSCLESLSCGTPVIVNKTGGLQDQPIDDEGNIFGVILEPSTKSLTGSQDIPYIFDMRASDEDIVAALKKMYDMTWDERKEMGKKASEWVRKAFSMKNMIDKWDKALTKYITEYKENGYKDRIRCVKI